MVKTQQKNKYMLIKACDTDILVIAVSVFVTHGLKEGWIEFGHGQSIRRLPVHDLVRNLDPEKSINILYCHASTGCDVVPTFHGEGKKTAWQT